MPTAEDFNWLTVDHRGRAASFSVSGALTSEEVASRWAIFYGLQKGRLFTAEQLRAVTNDAAEPVVERVQAIRHALADLERRAFITRWGETRGQATRWDVTCQGQTDDYSIGEVETFIRGTWAVLTVWGPKR